MTRKMQTRKHWSTHASPNPEQRCKNGQLYSGEDGADWGPCNIFPGEVVNAEGWCKSWVKKTG